MEVVDPRNTLITNQEVLELLNQAKEQQKMSRSQDLQNYNTIVYETCKYLSETPASHQSRENVIELAKALKKYKLTGAEIMQIANLRPKQALEVQLIVEECEERLSEEDVDELVETVCKILPEPSK